MGFSRGALAAACVSLVACSWTLDLDGLTGGGMDAATPVDGGGGGDASPSARPCLTAHAFCADFDGTDSGDVKAGWDDLSRDPSTTVSLDSARAVSSPRALLVSGPRVRGAGPVGSLSKILSVPFSHVRLDFDIYVERPDWQASDTGIGLAVILLRSYDSTGKTWITDIGVTFRITPDGARFTLDNDGPGPWISATPPLAYDRWVHVHVDLNLRGTFDMTVDGQAGPTTRFGAASVGRDPYVSLDIGRQDWNGQTSATPGFRISYDNVVVDGE